jgi:hypothetical protein
VIEKDDPRALAAEERAGNPWHLLLMVWAGIACVGVPALRRSRPLLSYLVALVAAFALFCAVLRWQPWGARLQLPLFVLSSPLCGVVLARILRRRAAAWLAMFLLIAALAWVLANSTSPS